MIKIKFPAALDRTRAFERIKDLARRKGVRFTGCVASGEFSGKGIEGRYQTRGNHLEVTISKRPFYLSEKKIEERLKTFFE